MDREGKVEKRANTSDLGGTMRKGAQRVPIKAGTRAQTIYGDEVNERHRHRYERPHAVGKPAGNDGIARPPLVRGRAVPPGVHFHAA
ncbi:hypothetical protein G6F50_018464 [Rhizopus delemar]|uniref:Uncharacterized protein n=1 Tax=Rhizopus delemar TaxID=936053 RepID=A0A9P7BZB4_9FUNG|nr:hypothetical protein G6F50_018464 [Rhizopus delemar]